VSLKNVAISKELQSSPENSKVRYYRKSIDLLTLLDKIKLWPSRKGILHGIKKIEYYGDYAIITTHCGESFKVRNSKNSRASRWIKKKWSYCSCGKCNIPEWKIKKYSSTIMTEKWGSNLKEHKC
jgi:pyrrolysyl-tRNA synthetase, N-terminal region